MGEGWVFIDHFLFQEHSVIQESVVTCLEYMFDDIIGHDHLSKFSQALLVKITYITKMFQSLVNIFASSMFRKPLSGAAVVPPCTGH